MELKPGDADVAEGVLRGTAPWLAGAAGANAHTAAEVAEPRLAAASFIEERRVAAPVGTPCQRPDRVTGDCALMGVLRRGATVHVHQGTAEVAVKKVRECIFTF